MGHGAEDRRWVRVGSSDDPDARTAGHAAAAAAQDGAGPARLLVVFSSTYLDTAAAMAGICEVTPDEVTIVGCTSLAELAGGQRMAGPGVVVTALGGDGFVVRTRVVTAASADRRAAGGEAAEVMVGVEAPHRALLLLVDGLTRQHHDLVRGAYAVLGATTPIVGGCSSDDFAYRLTYQLHGSGAGVDLLTDAVVAVGLGSDAPLGVGISHGWSRQGEPMVVTESEGGDVVSLDGEPALDVYLRSLGADRSLLADESAFREVAYQHPLGMSRRTGEDIRVVHSGDPALGSVQCLADVPQGALVWSMSSDDGTLVDAASESVARALDGLGGAAARGMLVFDCGARHAKLGPAGVRAEQAAIARSTPGVTVGGFYTFGEIARTTGSRGMHHLTVVSLALA